MALIVADRVRESSITIGTGSYALLGAVAGFRTFSAAIVNGNTTYYFVTGGDEWESGLGTVSAGVLARTAVHASSNAGAAVNWGPGTKTVTCGPTATLLAAKSDKMVVSTAAALAAIANAINTTDKYVGKFVADENNRVFWAVAATAGGVWYPLYDPLGLDKITPA